MEISRRCDYALRMLRAAYESDGEYISVTDVARHEHIPYSFARSIQHDLVKGGMLKTIRGSRGGLALACDPHQVTLLEVLETVQGKVSIAACSGDSSYCEKQPNCTYNRVWSGADKLLRNYFTSFTLADVLDLDEVHPTLVTISV